VNACNAEKPRFGAEDDGFSMRQLPGWEITREKGAIIFLGPAARGQNETTIVVRSVPLAEVRPTAREESGLSHATANVLAGLPNSNVSRAKPTGHDEMRGVRYQVSFDPPSKERRFERTQIALLGQDRLFHLMHTAPEGALQTTAPLFEEVVASLREE